MEKKTNINRFFEVFKYTKNEILLVLLSAFLFFLTHNGLYILVWVSFVPLMIAVLKNRLPKVILSTAIFSLVSTSVSVFWIYQYRPSSYLYPLTLVAYLFFFITVFSLSSLYCRRNSSYFSVFVPPAIWSLLQLAFASSFLGDMTFEMAKFMPETAPLIWFVGSKGITFLIILFNSSLAYFFMNKKGLYRKNIFLKTILKNKKLLYIPLTIALVFIACFIFSHVVEFDGEEITVAAVQGNFPQEWEWRIYYHNEIFSIYEKLSLDVADKNPDLIVWPEYSIPVDIIHYNGIYPERKSIFNKLEQLSSRLDSVLVIGSYFYNESTDVGQDVTLLFTPDEGYVGYYSSLIPMFYNLAATPADSKQDIMKTNIGKFGSIICFEEMRDEVPRKFVESGAEFIVSSSNNRNFHSGYKIASQFSRLRAAENGRFLLRSTNTGLTQLISPNGVVVSNLDIEEREVLVEKINLLAGKTFHTQFGRIILYVALFLIFIFMLFSLSRRPS